MIDDVAFALGGPHERQHISHHERRTESEHHRWQKVWSQQLGSLFSSDHHARLEAADNDSHSRLKLPRNKVDDSTIGDSPSPVHNQGLWMGVTTPSNASLPILSVSPLPPSTVLLCFALCFPLCVSRSQPLRQPAKAAHTLASAHSSYRTGPTLPQHTTQRPAVLRALSRTSRMG
jgi:hypothetical protein